MKTNIHFLSYLTHFFLELEMFQKKTVKKSKHTLCSIMFFFFENGAVYEKIWKNVVKRGRPQMAIWPMRLACWIPTATNTHTLRICNTYCFSTATTFARKRLSVTLYVCLILL
jgi:hypothetical protein